ALDDAVGLRALCLGPGMIDVLDGQVEFVFVAIMGAAVLGAAVGQNALQGHTVFLVEGNNPVVEQVGGGDRRLAIVELGEAELGVGVDEGLLVNTTNALQRTDVEPILSAAVTRTLGLELAMGLLVALASRGRPAGPR